MIKKINILFRLIFCFLLFIYISGICYGQNPDLGSWNIISLKYNINQKWNIFGEAQVRSLKFYNQFHYYEYKGGIEYRVHQNIKLTLAAGDYDTYKEGGNFVLPKNKDEFRIWPQIVLIQSVGKFKIEHRYRGEFRFTSDGYHNRFRYRLGLSYPFGKEKNSYQPYQINVSNELFFADKEPYFERNRLLFALNYRVSNTASVQIGYLHQFDYKINDETGRDFMQIGLFIEIFRKKNENSINDTNLKDN